ncbi:MAG: ABC transporter substrate-binding protein [Blastopirellula sp.]|nr:MAG: ABC transporter substrate-binding protein [Blastopirellula sp.]
MALAAVSTMSVISQANAAELVIGTFGGSFAKATEACHVSLFTKATGEKVLLTFGSSVQHAAKIRATKGNPEVDLAYMDISIAKQVKAEGLLEKIDFASLKEYGDVAKQAFDVDGTYVNFMTAATVIAYNPKVITTPPSSWSDLFDKKYAGRMALGDITGTSGLHFLLAANKMNGGDLNNMDPGFKALAELKANVEVFYTQADQIVSLFERGEVVIAPWYPDRIGSAADKGVPVAVAYPKEGAVGIQPTLVIPKGSKNKDLAMRFMEAVLSAEGQACFAEKKYAGPVNTKVTLSDKVSKIVPFGDNYQNLWYPDSDVVAKKRPEWTKRWQRQVNR